MASHGPLYLSGDLDLGERRCLWGSFLTVHALFSIYSVSFYHHLRSFSEVLFYFLK